LQVLCSHFQAILEQLPFLHLPLHIHHHLSQRPLNPQQKVLNRQSIAQIRGTTSEYASYLFGEGVEEAAEEQPGRVADFPVVAAHPLGGVSGGTEARGLRGSGEEAGRGGRAGEAAPGGRREGVVPEVVPAEPPGATRRKEGRDPPGACGRGGVATGGAGGGDTGEERVGEGDEGGGLAKRDAERGSAWGRRGGE